MLIAVYCILALAVGGSALAQDIADAQGESVASTSRTPYELNDEYSRRIRKVDWSILSTLQACEDTGVAIQAAWEHVRRSLPNQRPEYEGLRPPPIDRKAANRFLGFVEGRLRVSAPPWWQELIVSGRGHILSNGQHSYRFNGTALGRYYEQTVGDGDDDVLLLGLGVRLKRYNPELLDLDIDGKTVGFPLRETLRRNVSATAVKDPVYVAVSHSFSSATSEMIAVDAERKERVWIAKIWGEVPLLFRSGWGGFHWIDFRHTADEVIVFGALEDVVYAEAFTIADGKPDWRFSSTYCTPLGGTEKK
jgi:hypothetical protein